MGVAFDKPRIDLEALRSWKGKTATDQTFVGAGKGHIWRLPIIERVDVMDMTAMSIDVCGPAPADLSFAGSRSRETGLPLRVMTQRGC